MAIVYDSPEYDEKKYKDGIDTSYYTNAIQKYTDAQEKNRATQIGEAEKQKANALREAYVTRLQNQKTLNENLARAGIRGGATETSNLKIANAYANQRNAANTDYTNSVNSINRGVDENILNYDMDMTSRAEEYAQNLAQAKWNAAREDYANAIQQQNWETELAYQQQQDAIANALQREQFDYQKQQDALANDPNSLANKTAEYQYNQMVWADKYDNKYVNVTTKTKYNNALDKLKTAKSNGNISSEEYNYAVGQLQAAKANNVANKRWKNK